MREQKKTVTPNELGDEALSVSARGWKALGKPGLAAKLRERSCGSCQVCCEILGVDEIKPPNEKCVHQGPGGCAIYDGRPATCATFLCAWRVGLLAKGDRPDRIGVMVDAAPGEHDPMWALRAQSEWPDGREIVRIIRALVAATGLPVGIVPIGVPADFVTEFLVPHTAAFDEWIADVAHDQVPLYFEDVPR